MEDHITARLRPPGLDKRQVAGGDLGVEGEVELAPAAAAPLAQLLADCADLLCHRVTMARDEEWANYL